MSTPQPTSSEQRPKSAETCPECGGRMVVSVVIPIMFSDGREDITYRCQECGGEIKRSGKAQSY
jgi:ssDNA-binding Zn-finger/Zn-ribbon topoisomerase 1